MVTSFCACHCNYLNSHVSFTNQEACLVLSIHASSQLSEPLLASYCFSIYSIYLSCWVIISSIKAQNLIVLFSMYSKYLKQWLFSEWMSEQMCECMCEWLHTNWINLLRIILALFLMNSLEMSYWHTWCCLVIDVPRLWIQTLQCVLILLTLFNLISSSEDQFFPL